VLFRVAAVVGLLSAGFWSALPWLGCIPNPVTHIVDPLLLRVCTFGLPGLWPGDGFPGFSGPYWGNLIVGIAYLIAALFVGFTKRRS
jgi:hypothetical protein